MTPTPQETVVTEHEKKTNIPQPLTGEEVVISGMSGIFPRSDNVQDFKNNLFNKVDMVTSDDPRWVFAHPEVPAHLGKVKGMGQFDAQFFRVHFKQACTMEPMSRKLLEHAYSAIYDSGINPLQLRGKKVGVFIGSTFSESEKNVIYETIQRNGFGITGCNKAMYANRISYWIDGKGPSYALDLACASSMACLEHAYRSISSGQCDAAIVGGCNLCMHPCVSLNLKRAGFLCADGKTKCFDKKGDGYVRSDSISVLFLQKSKDAKRIYSEVYHAKANYSLRADAEFLPIRETKDIREFLEHFYSEIDVSPKDVEYVEAYGCGISKADGNELEAIGQVFAKEEPITVGSVKSNMGHSEPASGVCALTKVCLAYQKGQIPANLHYTEPLDHVLSVREGKVQIPIEHKPFTRGFSALNSFSYSGANIHVLLKGHYKPKDPEKYKSSIPHIILLSGRQESCVTKILDELKQHPVDPEAIGLLHNIHEYDIPGHMCRGYTILSTDENNKTVSLAQHLDYCPGNVRPIWFIYSGMGSQWAGMGAELMKIPIFAAAIHKCCKVLEPKGLDLLHILTNPDKSIYDNILNSFVGIAAVQIGLTDILREMGIVPDNIIGHSVGELGCAYADGCFTAEEMILSAYSRGLVSVQTPFIRGSMAAVGLSYKSVLPLCPPEIEVACHNSAESSTISGPADIMKEFVGELTKRGVFAKEVPCSNIAYHSKYIADAGPGLLKYLSEVIKEPKLRSPKWVSTSVPQENWSEPIAQYSSAEYHTNNLLNSVLFEETSKLIPANAIVIEVAPHGLLQAIVKRSLPECTHIPLTRRAHADPVKFFLESIGKLYQAGLNPKVDKLYPQIQFPVSTETQLLSHLVEWEHSENWPQAKYNTKDRVTAAAREFVMSIHDDDYRYLEGYVRNGNNVFPEAAMLELIWETFAMQKGVPYKELSVLFTEMQFHAEAKIMNEVPLRFGIMIHKGNNRFELSYEQALIASGFIFDLKSSRYKSRELTVEDEVLKTEVTLTASDIYKILYLKGFNYSGKFQSILTSNNLRDKAQIKWEDEWVPFIDALIQLNTLSKDQDGVFTPKMLKKLVVDVESHKSKDLVVTESGTYYNATLLKNYQTTICGGIEMEGLVLYDKPKETKKSDVMTTCDFVPYFLTGEVNMETALHINFGLMSENINEKDVQVTEIVNTSSSVFSNTLKSVTEQIPHAIYQFKYVDVNTDLDAIIQDQTICTSQIFIVHNILNNEKMMKLLHGIVPKDSFILSFEHDTTKIALKYELFNVLTAMNTQKHFLVLLKKNITNQDSNVSYIPVVNDSKFSWVSMVTSELKKNKKVVLVSERQAYCGLLGLVKSLRKEYNKKLSLVLIEDIHAPVFNAEKDVYKQQLSKNLAINVLKKGQWGGYYNLPNRSSVHIRNAVLTNTVSGDLDSLTWVEATPPTSSNIIQVCYAGASFRDAQKALGNTTSKSTTYGMDFSGIDCRGERVMGLVEGGSIGTTVVAHPDLLWPVPDHWTLEEAASVPLPYIQALYCLTIQSFFCKGLKIFVHGGAGALGQAIISLCLALDCTVYTTVSDVKKKRFLMRLFPQLRENQIGNSRDYTFVTSVLTDTEGKRCNIVINCATGTLREATTKCVGFSGYFLDVSETDMAENRDFGMIYLVEEKTYKAVRLDSIFKPDNADERKALQLMLAEGIINGYVRPLSRVVYSPSEVTRGFRLLASSRHRGRVLVRIHDPTTANQGLEVIPRISFSSKASYVVICDSTEYGIELADKLVRNGAKKLIIHLKPNSVVGYFCAKLAAWREYGIIVKISSENLQTEQGCINLMKEASRLGAVQGVFISQLGETTKAFDSVTQNDFLEKFGDTGLITANLDLVSRNICNELLNFVVLTKESQNAVDCYTNSVSERICRARAEVGLPALCLKTTLLDKFGKNISQNSKLQPQPLAAFFNALDVSLKLKYNNVETYQLKKKHGQSFFERILNIIGKNLTEVSQETITLEELRLNEENIEEIKTIIKEANDIILPNDRLKAMTIKELKELSDNMRQVYSKFESGLGAFYTFIDEDECQSTEPLVAMPTKLSNATENEEELDTKATYLMLLPGLEGHHQIFIPICERLKVQAMTFQLGPDIAHDGIASMAEGIMKFMKKRFELKSKFYLMGYSFGVNVALELAALLEKEGHVGTVFCLDSSPDALRAHLDAYLGNVSENELQDMIVEHMYKLMTGESSEELRQDLQKAESWSDKAEACVNRIRGLVHYSHQYKRSLLDSAYRRIQLSRDYEPLFRLNSEIVLMKGIPHPRAQGLTEDYNLSKYTKQPVKVFQLEMDHALAPLDCRVSNIVNRLFDPAVLEEFKLKNLCETYLADPFKIL